YKDSNKDKRLNVGGGDSVRWLMPSNIKNLIANAENIEKFAKEKDGLDDLDEIMGGLSKVRYRDVQDSLDLQLYEYLQESRWKIHGSIIKMYDGEDYNKIRFNKPLKKGDPPYRFEEISKYQIENYLSL